MDDAVRLRMTTPEFEDPVGQSRSANRVHFC
jgi:hypothetical protein